MGEGCNMSTYLSRRKLKEINNQQMNDGGCFFNYLLGEYNFKMDNEISIDRPKAEIKKFIKNSSTIIIELTQDSGGVPCFENVSKGEIIDFNVYNGAYSFYNYDLHEQINLIGLPFGRKYFIELSSNTGRKMEICIGVYVGRHYAYLEEKYCDESFLYLKNEDDAYYNLQTNLDLNIPKLYGKRKYEMLKSLRQNTAIIIGLLKEKGFTCPFNVIEDFCIGKRDTIFFNKMRIERKTPTMSLSEAKKLFDEGALTQKEFDKIKQRVLEEFY